MRKLINPSYSNQIYIFTEPNFRFDLTEFSSKDTKVFIRFEFSPRVSDEFISIKSIVRLIEKETGFDTELQKVTVDSTYQLIKDHDFTAEELYPIVEDGMAQLILAFTTGAKRLSEYHKMPEYPQLSQLRTQLEALAQDVNQST